MLEGAVLRERYKVLSLLGEGGFGRTYKGIDTNTQSLIAIKTISFSQMQNWKALEFFERESIVLAKLDHPGIPKYIDFFYEDSETDRCFYLVRELAVGESLSDLAKKGWRATEEEVKHIIEQLLEILVYLHNLVPPIIHRDIKPSNIIYQPDTRQVFLIDFGSVQDKLGGGTVVGTFGYMAPEQLGGETSPKSDIYCVAMTLAFLLTQREPSELPYQRMKLNLRSLQVSASNELLKWLERASEPIPDNRFSSAEDALRSLRFGTEKKLEVPVGSKIQVTKDEDSLKITFPWIGWAKCYVGLQNVMVVRQGLNAKYVELLSGETICIYDFLAVVVFAIFVLPVSCFLLIRLLDYFFVVFGYFFVIIFAVSYLVYLVYLIYRLCRKDSGKATNPVKGVRQKIVIINSGIFSRLKSYILNPHPLTLFPLGLMLWNMNVESLSHTILLLFHLDLMLWNMNVQSLSHTILLLFHLIYLSYSLFLALKTFLTKNFMILKISKKDFIISHRLKYFPTKSLTQFNLSMKKLRCTRQTEGNLVKKIILYANKTKVITLNNQFMTEAELSWLYKQISLFLNNGS
jgi:serine/threonine protein kinase